VSNYWTDDELARFDYFVLDGVRSPGTNTAITINRVKLNYDSVKGFGLSGEFLRFTGLGLAEISFTIELIDADDRAAEDDPKWQRASAPPVQGQVDRIRTVSHPILERMRAVTPRWRLQEVPDLSALRTSTGGGVIIEVPFKNDRKPLPQVGKPKDPLSAAKGKVPNPLQEAIAGVGALVKAEIGKGKT
jgi:hypothetical protein